MDEMGENAGSLKGPSVGRPLTIPVDLRSSKCQWVQTPPATEVPQMFMKFRSEPTLPL